MNHETMKEVTGLLEEAKRENDRAIGANVFRIQKSMALVIRVLIILVTELTLIGCSGGVFRSYNQSDAGEQWLSDAAPSDLTSDAQATGGSVGTTLIGLPTGGLTGNSLDGSGGSTGFPVSSSSGGFLAATGGSTFEGTGGASHATGGASQYHDPGECPCPANNACQVSASGCNVPGTKGNEGNEIFTCVVSPLHCATAARPVFCFQC